MQKYKIAISKIKITSDEKSSKKIALKKYLNLKKGNLSFDETLVVDQNSNMIIPNEIGKVAKPIKYNGNYVIVKLLEKQPSKILPFEKVSVLVPKDFLPKSRKSAKFFRASFFEIHLSKWKAAALCRLRGLNLFY